MPDHSRRTEGRPRRPENLLRVHTLRVSVSTPELEQIRARAQSRGLRAGPYLRRAALLGSSETDARLVALGRLLLEFRGVAANLNQHSHRANLLIAEARGQGRHLDLDAIENAQRAMAELAPHVEHTAASVRAALAQITGRTQA